MMRVGSLFSGIGGIELGLERAGGFETVWFVENDLYAKAVLKKHWSNATIYDDITKLDFATIPRVDVLTGGFPCQDISNAGKRAGITGSRSSLWKYYVEAIRVLRPRIVLAENVAAIIDRGLDVVLSDLASLGYDAEWHCVPAAAVGAPHRRDRIIIMAYADGERCVYGQVGEQSDSRGEYALRNIGESGQDVADADGAGFQATRPEQSTTGSGRSGQDVANTDSGRFQSGCYGHNEIFLISSSNKPGEKRSLTGHWSVEPCVGRVADGVPNRVDRIKCLGNAVVPEWSQAIGETIKEKEGLK
jgi:DNA (cytosine-5)-methyltransferase 1